MGDKMRGLADFVTGDVRPGIPKSMSGLSEEEFWELVKGIRMAEEKKLRQEARLAYRIANAITDEEGD